MYKQAGLSWYTRLIIIFVILGGFLTFSGTKTIIYMSKEPVDIFELDSWDELKPGMHVKCEIPMIWDAYISNVTERKTFGITTSEKETGREYLVPHIIETSRYYEIEGFISYSSSNYSLMDKMIEESDKWYNDTTGRYECETTVPVEGYLTKLSNDELKYMREYLSYGMDASEVDSYIYPYKIAQGASMKSGILFLVLGIGSFVIVAIVIILRIRSKKQQEMMANIKFKVSDTTIPDSFDDQNMGM